MKSFTVSTQVKTDSVINALVSAREGGSNYWYSQIDPLKRTSKSKSVSTAYYQDLVKHGFTLVDSQDDGLKRYKITPERIQKGLEIMANEYPKHFSDLVNDDGDAITGDVFLQCIVFRDVIYG